MLREGWNTEWNGVGARVIKVDKSGQKRKSIKVTEELWAVIKGEADKNGRTILGELKKKYETP